jgi:hypothetical protein
MLACVIMTIAATITVVSALTADANTVSSLSMLPVTPRSARFAWTIPSIS